MPETIERVSQNSSYHILPGRLYGSYGSAHIENTAAEFNILKYAWAPTSTGPQFSESSFIDIVPMGDITDAEFSAAARKLFAVFDDEE